VQNRVDGSSRVLDQQAQVLLPLQLWGRDLTFERAMMKWQVSEFGSTDDCRSQDEQLVIENWIQVLPSLLFFSVNRID